MVISHKRVFFWLEVRKNIYLVRPTLSAKVRCKETRQVLYVRNTVCGQIFASCTCHQVTIWCTGWPTFINGGWWDICSFSVVSTPWSLIGMSCYNQDYQDDADRGYRRWHHTNRTFFSHSESKYFWRWSKTHHLDIEFRDRLLIGFNPDMVYQG